MQFVALALHLLLTLERGVLAAKKPPCVIETVDGIPTTWYEKMRFENCSKSNVRGFAKEMNRCLVTETSDDKRDLEIRIDTARGNSSTLCRALDGVASCYTLMFTAPCLVEQEVKFFQQEYLSTKSLLFALCNGTSSLFDRLEDGSIDCLAKLGPEHTCCEMEAAKDLLVAEKSSICKYFTQTTTCLQKYLLKCSEQARNFLNNFLRSEEFVVGCNQDGEMQERRAGSGTDYLSTTSSIRIVIALFFARHFVV